MWIQFSHINSHCASLQQESLQHALLLIPMSKHYPQVWGGRRLLCGKVNNVVMLPSHVLS